MNLVVLQNFLDNISFAVLFVTMLVYWVGAAFPNIPAMSVLGTSGMMIANLCIATLLGARWLEAGYFPLSNLYESLFFLAWGITTVHLIAENTSHSRLVGVATAPVAMAIAASATLTLPSEMQSAEPLVPSLKSNWLMMHVSVMMLSYAALIVGSLLAIAFLVVTRGQNIQLQGNSISTGGYRSNGYSLHSSGEMISQLPAVAVENNGTTRLLNNSNGKTAVLDLVTTPTIEDSETLSPQRLSIAETLSLIHIPSPRD